MKVWLYSGSVVGLILTILPSVLLYTGSISQGTMSAAMTAGMLVWVVCRSLPLIHDALASRHRD